MSSAHSAEDNEIYKNLWKKMSVKFVENYNEMAKSRTSLDLETILTWSALPKFMKVLCKYLFTLGNDNVVRISV